MYPSGVSQELSHSSARYRLAGPEIPRASPSIVPELGWFHSLQTIDFRNTILLPSTPRVLILETYMREEA